MDPSFVKHVDENLKATLEWLETLDDTQYGYIRLGESDDDNVVKGTPWDYGVDWTKKITTT